MFSIINCFVMSILNKIKNKKNIEGCKKICSVVVISAVVSLVINVLLSRNVLTKKSIEKNPKFIIDAIEKMYKEEQQKQQQEASKKAPEIAKQIERSSKSVIGNKNGNKLIVEFFDYNCGHCKRQAVELKKIIEQNKDVKVILADLPILSANSLLAAQVGIYISLHENSKLEKFYTEFTKTQADPASIKAVLKKLKIDEKIIEKAKKDENVKSIIEQNYSYAKEIGIQGTPALIVNGKYFGGMIQASDLLSLLK